MRRANASSATHNSTIRPLKGSCLLDLWVNPGLSTPGEINGCTVPLTIRKPGGKLETETF